MIPFDEKNIMNNTIFPPAFGADENMKQGTNDREIRYKPILPAFIINAAAMQEEQTDGK